MANIDTDTPILRLARLYGDNKGLAQTTVSLYASGQGALFARLHKGASVTMRRHAKISQWFSDHWPHDLTWPTDIPRPTPNPSVNRAPVHRNGTPEPTPLESALALGANGQIASPQMLCAALGVRDYVFYEVVRTYADGRPGEQKWPRRLRNGRSPTMLILQHLIAVGDKRFASRPRLADLPRETA